MRLKRTSENSETQKTLSRPLVMIFDRVGGWGQEEGGRGQQFQMGGSEGPDKVGRGQLGAIQGQQGPDGVEALGLDGEDWGTRVGGYWG